MVLEGENTVADGVVLLYVLERGADRDEVLVGVAALLDNAPLVGWCKNAGRVKRVLIFVAGWSAHPRERWQVVGSARSVGVTVVEDGVKGGRAAWSLSGRPMSLKGGAASSGMGT